MLILSVISKLFVLFYFQSAHLAMIDTLMMAYTVEMVSIEKVIACAQQYSAFFQATDLPYDIEDAVVYWINKVGLCSTGSGSSSRKLKSAVTHCSCVTVCFKSKCKLKLCNLLKTFCFKKYKAEPVA